MWTGVAAFLVAASFLVPPIAAGPPGGAVWLSSTAGELAAMTSPREGTCAAASSEDRIYVGAGYGFQNGAFVGDSSEMEAYDVDSDTWVSLAEAPTSRSEGAGAAHGGLFYCIGGRSFTVLSTNERYDPTTDSWSTLAPMPTARAGLGVVAVANQIYAAGGRTGTTPNSGVPLPTLEAYNVVTGTWAALPPMPFARGDVAVAAHGNKVYVAGGWNPACAGPPAGMCNDLQAYDVATGLWSVLASMPTARSNSGAAVAGNNLFVIGGAQNLGNVATNEGYSIAKGTWSTATAKPTPTSEVQAVVHGARVYMAGSGIFGQAQGIHEALLVNTV
ncbi:MAG: hypothetical protein HYT80_09715 [Euryarchaeota archaeon]|nr:hypothetical protein [Euryarchaeota archaeon]